MLNSADLSMLLIKQGKFSFVWDSAEIIKEKTTLWFVDSDNKTMLKIPVKSLTKDHFLEGVKNYFGSTPFSLYVNLPLDCECDGCTDDEDEEVEIEVIAVFDKRKGE